MFISRARDAPFPADELVRVVRGPLVGLLGTVVQITADGRCVLHSAHLPHGTRVVVPSSWLEPAAEPPPFNS